MKCIYKIFVFFVLVLPATLFSQEFFNINEVESGFISIKISDKLIQSNNSIMVIREKGAKPIAPDLNKKYKVSTTFSSPDSNSYTGMGNCVMFMGKGSDNLRYAGLKPDTYYSIDLYTKDTKQYKSISTQIFTTLAELPQQQVKKILWTELSPFSMKIMAAGATSESQLVVISKSQNDFVPAKGVGYKANRIYGKGEELGNGVYVVKSANDTNSLILIENLEPDSYYYLKAYAFNGVDKSANYLTQTKIYDNDVRIATQLETPKMISFTSSQTGGTKIEWSEVKGVVYYEFELSHDKNFEILESAYGRVDVGNTTNYVLEDLPTGKEYFVRVRAVGKVSSSEYSSFLKKKL